jgi:hypothetical protein
MLFELVPDAGIEFLEKIAFCGVLPDRLVVVHVDPPHTK